MVSETIFNKLSRGVLCGGGFCVPLLGPTAQCPWHPRLRLSPERFSNSTPSLFYCHYLSKTSVFHVNKDNNAQILLKTTSTDLLYTAQILQKSNLVSKGRTIIPVLHITKKHTLKQHSHSVSGLGSTLSKQRWSCI